MLHTTVEALMIFRGMFGGSLPLTGLLVALLPQTKIKCMKFVKTCSKLQGFSYIYDVLPGLPFAESALLKGRLSQLTCMKPFDWSMQHNDADAPAPLSRELRETIKRRCGRHKLSFSRKTLLVNLRIRAFLLFFYILFHSSNHHGKRVFIFFFPKIAML